MFNNSGITSAAATTGSSSANLPPFSSPFFESPHLSLGSMTFDFPSRHLSPNLGSTRLGYSSMIPTPQMNQQHQVFQQQQQQQQQQQLQQQQQTASQHLKRDYMSSNPVDDYRNANSEVASASTTSTVGTGPIRLIQEPPPPPVFDTEKAKKAMFSVTSNLANLERFSQQEKSQGGIVANANSKNMSVINSSQQQQQQQPQQQQHAAFNPMQSSQGTPSLTSVAGSQLIGSAFFESPLLSNAVIDYGNSSRQVSPPSTAAFLNSVLPPDTPGKGKAISDPVPPGHLGQAHFKKSAAVVSNLMNAELKSQTQKKKQEPGPMSSNISLDKGLEDKSGSGNVTPQLFPPVDQASARPPSTQQQQQQQQASNFASQSQQNNTNNNFGLNSNLIRSHRLSMGNFMGAGTGDDNKDMLGGFDINFGGDFGYPFSPGDVVRSLAPSIPESPLAQNLRMYSSYGSYPSSGPSYSSLMPSNQSVPSQSWQPPAPQPYQPPHSQHPHRLPPLAPYSSLVAQHQSGKYDIHHSAPHQFGLGKGKGVAPKRPRKDNSDDDDDGGSDEQGAKKKTRKPPMPDDPNEPKITSKHRGVCWYKRTKKWVVQTKVNGKRVHVGYFDDEEKAAEAYRNAVQSIQIKKALEAKQKSQTMQLQQQQLQLQQSQGNTGPMSSSYQ